MWANYQPITMFDSIAFLACCVPLVCSIPSRLVFVFSVLLPYLFMISCFYVAANPQWRRAFDVKKKDIPRYEAMLMSSIKGSGSEKMTESTS